MSRVPEKKKLLGFGLFHKESGPNPEFFFLKLRNFDAKVEIVQYIQLAFLVRTILAAPHPIRKSVYESPHVYYTVLVI